LTADRLIANLGRERFSRGARLNVDTDELRATYRRVLKRADDGNITELLAFARA